MVLPKSRRIELPKFRPSLECLDSRVLPSHGWLSKLYDNWKSYVAYLTKSNYFQTDGNKHWGKGSHGRKGDGDWKEDGKPKKGTKIDLTVVPTQGTGGFTVTVEPEPAPAETTPISSIPPLVAIPNVAANTNLTTSNNTLVGGGTSVTVSTTPVTGTTGGSHGQILGVTASTRTVTSDNNLPPINDLNGTYVANRLPVDYGAYAPPPSAFDAETSLPNTGGGPRRDENDKLAVAAGKVAPEGAIPAAGVTLVASADGPGNLNRGFTHWMDPAFPYVAPALGLGLEDVPGLVTPLRGAPSEPPVAVVDVSDEDPERAPVPTEVAVANALPLPDAQAAGMLARFLPFDPAAVGRSIDRFLDRVSLGELGSGRIGRKVVVVSALALTGVLVIRRRNRKNLHQPSARSLSWLRQHMAGTGTWQ
jgi:hypothetical protein